MVRFVTSFSGKHYDIYAKKMLDSVVEHWADDLKLIVYYDTVTEEQKKDFPKSPIIEYRDLDKVEDRAIFLDKMKGYDGTSNGQMPYDFRMDALRFCHKVYALTDYFLEISENEAKGGWLIWMDADVLTTSPLSEEILFQAFPKDSELIHLGRTDIDFSETGFIGFNLDTMHSHYFLADIRGCYDIGEVLAYREWTDAFIMTRFIKIYAAHGMKVHNLSEGASGLAVFPQSKLADFMIHYKGNLKNTIGEDIVTPDVNLPRYHQLAVLIREYKPKRIVEVGTWNGGRAIEMALAAFENSKRVHYTGFDLFEDATFEIDRKEQNTKPHNNFDAVKKRLEDFAGKMKEDKKTFTFTLLKGDSKETMPKAKKELKKADFAFIDGGHSEETILSDYENLIHVPVVALDDYYSKDINDKIPSDEFLGTNRLVESLKGTRIFVLPSQDKVKDGGTVHLAVRLKTDDLADLPKELNRTPIIIQPKDCVPKDDILDNINDNVELT
jgi:precorrin-6B methylase 2